MEVFGADFNVVSLPVVLHYHIYVVPLFQLVDLRVVSLDSFPGHSQVMRVVYVGAVVPREVPIGDIGFTLWQYFPALIVAAACSLLFLQSLTCLAKLSDMNSRGHVWHWRILCLLAGYGVEVDVVLTVSQSLLFLAFEAARDFGIDT
jgi:hypothetical protein